MASVQAVWGIDVGRSALKAIKLRTTGDGGAEVVAVDVIEHAKILSQPDANRPELISSALERFLSHNDISKDQIVVSVPGQHTLSRFTKLPPVAPKRIPDIVRYEADQQIPFDLDEVIWDYQTFQQEGMPDIEVGIFAMKRELIREHLLHLEQAGIEPIVVQSGPLAVYNAIAYDGLLCDETTIIIDVGAENSDLIIGTPTGLWTRTVPIGGNSFTEALVKSFKLSFSKAEALKRTAASSKYARQVFQAMRPVFADLVQELQRSIGFYSSTHRDASVERVIPLGNAFRLPGLQKYLQQNLGIDVLKPDSFKKASQKAVSGNEAFREHFLGFMTAYGLALQGLDLTIVNSNLLPTEIAKQVVWRKKRPAFAAAAACFVLAGGLVWFRQAADERVLASSSAGDVPSSMTIDQADAIIQNGPPSSASPRVRAETIVVAGKTLKSKLSKLGGQGDAERRESERLIEVMANKSVVPDLYQLIHDAVPRPGAPAAEEATPEQERAALTAGPRASRQVVTIRTLNMHFEPDLKAFDWKSQVDLPDPVNDYEFGKGGELPGFRFQLTCRTPNKDGASFMKDRFLVPLIQSGRKEGTGFYVDRVALVKGGKVEPAGVGGFRRSVGRGRRGGFTPPPTAGAGAEGVAVPPDQLDPVTLEPNTNDWEFEVWVSIILQDYPGGEE